MTDWKKIGKKLLFPPVWCMLLLTAISTVCLVLVFVKGLDTHPVAYGIYVLSFYALSVDCVFCAMVLPKRYRHIKKMIYDNKFGNRYMTDAVFRTHISLHTSLGINLLYVGINVVSAFVYHTAWFGILAVYYTILAVMRFILLRYVNHNSLGENLPGEWKRARVCAGILTLINLCLSGAILMVMYQNKGFVYHGILVYVMAMYTFYVTSVAIVNIVKYRKPESPVMTTSKIITLAAALVSMLSLETAMLTAFGADTALHTKRILIAATGAGISITVLAMSTYLIIRSTREIKRIKENTENGG